MEKMKIIPIESGPIATMGYFVYDEKDISAIVIDVPMDSCFQFLEFQEMHKKKIEHIILTHSHWDHTADADELRKNTKAKIYIHQADEYRIIQPHENLPFALPFEIKPFKADAYIDEGSKIQIGDMKFEVLHTPGHTEGSICLVEMNKKVIFSGDTIFFEGVGRTDLSGGSTYLLLKSIREKIMNLPDDFQIYSGHGRTTTVGYERLHNYFLL